MDYQAGILGRMDEREALLARAADAIAAVRRQGGQVGYVRVAFSTTDLGRQLRDPEVHEFLATKIFPRQARVIMLAELDAVLSGP